jgi:hypothetical protein
LIIFEKALLPSYIDCIEGNNCWTFNAGNRMQSKILRIFPLVYPGEAGQIFEPLTH